MLDYAKADAHSGSWICFDFNISPKSPFMCVMLVALSVCVFLPYTVPVYAPFLALYVFFFSLCDLFMCVCRFYNHKADKSAPKISRLNYM